MGLLGAALVTAVAVRWSAWLGDVGSVSIWRLLLEISGLLLGCIVFAIWAAGIEMMRAAERADRDRERDRREKESDPSYKGTAPEIAYPSACLQFQPCLRGLVIVSGVGGQLSDAGIIKVDEVAAAPREKQFPNTDVNESEKPLKHI